MTEASLSAGLDAFDHRQAGAEIYALVERLYPLCRSITGDGLRETLRALQELIPLSLHEVPSGSPVFDWTVPKEWNVRDAYIKDPEGRKVVDFRAHNLHLVSYSVPMQRKMPLSELKEHLHSLPEHPDWIPYRTSYYNEAWGFCLAHNRLLALRDGDYEVCIDTTLSEGALTYGEALLPGESDDEVLIFAHACHPSLCNDNLSGIGLAVFLARFLAPLELRYSYRFVFAPATIGSITWLSRNEAILPKIRHGLVASVLGDPGNFHYKRTYDGNAEIDRAVVRSLGDLGLPFEVRDFEPWGYDERQFNSPGLRLPVGRLTRSPNGEYAEYHTSADDLDLVRPECLGESLKAYLSVINVLEGNKTYRNLAPKGEPQLGRRGLYRKLGGQQTIALNQLAMLWVLNCSDGQQSLLDIAERANLPFRELQAVAETLEASGLLETVET